MKRIGAFFCVPLALFLCLFFFSGADPARLLAQQCPQGYTLNGGTCVVSGTPIAINAYCQGAVSASNTISFMGFGANAASSPCSTGFTTGLADWVAPSSGTVTAVRAISFSTGVNASSGLLTIQKNDVAQAVTCTFGTGTTCTDTAHSFNFAAGDRIGITMTTQVAETLAAISVGIRALLN